MELVGHSGYPTLEVARTAKSILTKLDIESILVQFEREESFRVIGLDSPKMLCSHKVIEDEVKDVDAGERVSYNELQVGDRFRLALFGSTNIWTKAPPSTGNKGLPIDGPTYTSDGRLVSWHRLDRLDEKVLYKVID